MAHYNAFFPSAPGGSQQAPLPPPQHHNASTSHPHALTNGQNMAASQQHPLPQNAIPGLPAGLMAALNGVSPEQLMAIVHAVKSGQLSLPESVAGPLADVVQQAATNGQLDASSGSVQPIANPQQDVDMDKEDGELEDGEEQEPAKERDFLRPPPTGPRKRSPSPRDRHGRAQSGRRASHEQQITSPKPATTRRRSSQAQRGRQGPTPPTNSQRVTTNGAANGRRSVDAGVAARAFVLQMHQNGYTFDQLASEIPNRSALRRMYKTLGLPLPADAQANGNSIQPLQPPQLDGAAARPPPPAFTKPAAVNPTTAVRPAAIGKPSAAVDRAEYLAKLAAARTPKDKVVAMHAATTPTAQQQPAPQPGTAVTVSVPPQTQAVTQSATPPSAAKPAPPNKIKNDLIKARLEKLKAQQAEKKLAAQQSSDGMVASSPLAKPAQASDAPKPQTNVSSGSANGVNGLGAGLTPQRLPIAAPVQLQPVQPGQVLPAPLQTSLPPALPTPNRPFSSLPGLFMASTPVQSSPLPQTFAQSVAPTVQPPTTMQPPQYPVPITTNKTSAPSPSGSPAPLNISRKRPVAADFDTDIPASAAPSAPKRPLFGQSRSNSESERVVIEVSEDEDDEDDMDIDPEPLQAGANGVGQQTSAQLVGPLPGLPARPSFSTPGTPSVQTPGSAADMDKAIADLRRKIAEREANKVGKTNGKVTTAVSEVSTPVSRKSTPVLAPVAAPLTVDTSIAEVSMQASAQASASAVSSNAGTEKSIARSQERARLEARLRELHQKTARQDGTLMDNASSNEAPTAATVSEINSAKGVPGLDSAPVPTTNGTTAREEPTVIDSREGSLGDKTITQPLLTQNLDDDRIGSQATTVTGTSQPETDVSATDNTTLENTANLTTDAMNIEANGPALVPYNTGNARENDPSRGHGRRHKGYKTRVCKFWQEGRCKKGDQCTYLHEVPDRGAGGVDVARETSNVKSDDEYVESDDSAQHHVDGTAAQSQEQGGATGSVETSSVSSDTSKEQEIERGEEADYEPQPDVDMSAVMDEDDDYEPEPAGGQSSTAFAGTDQDVVPRTISDVASTQPAAGEGDTMQLDDDLAPELQPSKEGQVVVTDEGKTPKNYYKPYESALTKFKDYRYHPSYLSTVSGGFKSTSYNHNIDAVKPLCQYEAAGGQCNDRDCVNQHFRTMGLTDNELLKVLGTVRTPTSTAADRARWNAGLGAVVRQLRDTANSKDVNAIATRIAEYRREFIGDPTVTLHLA